MPGGRRELTMKLAGGRMVGVLGLTFALRLASLSGTGTGTGGEVGAPAPGPGPAAGVLAAPVLPRLDWPSDPFALSARKPGPAASFALRASYRPQDWVALVADQLNVRDTRVVQVALWVASCPLRLDASEARVYLRVTLPMP